MPKLVTVFGYKFKDEGLLNLALTHSSAGQYSNERLEFLGDSVLSLTAAEYLYKNFADEDEGTLTSMRAYLVRSEALYECALAEQLEDKLIVSQGVLKPSLLSDACEAVFGAIYLDGGLESAEKAILLALAPRIETLDGDVIKDSKTAIKEYLSKKGLDDVTYETYKELGPPHDKTFFVRLKYNGKYLSEGVGKSKKAAQQDAAGKAVGIIIKD